MMKYPEINTFRTKESHGIYTFDPFPEKSHPVLLLHGLGASGISWQMQFEALREAGYRPISPDIPGFGKSHWAKNGWSFNQVLSCMVDWIASLEINSFSVVGLSMGGVFAQQLAILLPHQIEAAILVNTFARLRPKNLSQIAYFLQRFFIANFISVDRQAEIVAQRIFPRTDQGWLRTEAIREICNTDPAVYRAAMRDLAFIDLRKELYRITAPVLVVSGSEDTTISFSDQKDLVHSIKGAQHIIIQGTGHALPVEKPDLFNEYMIKFLSQFTGSTCVG